MKEANYNNLAEYEKAKSHKVISLNKIVNSNIKIKSTDSFIDIYNKVNNNFRQGM